MGEIYFGKRKNSVWQKSGPVKTGPTWPSATPLIPQYLSSVTDYICGPQWTIKQNKDEMRRWDVKMPVWVEMRLLCFGYCPLYVLCKIMYKGFLLALHHWININGMEAKHHPAQRQAMETMNGHCTMSRSLSKSEDLHWRRSNNQHCSCQWKNFITDWQAIGLPVLRYKWYNCIINCVINCCCFPGLQVRDEVDELLKSEGLEICSDDDRLQHLLSICLSTKVHLPCSVMCCEAIFY